MPARKTWKDAFYNAKSMSRNELLGDILSLELRINEQKASLGDYSYLAKRYVPLEESGGFNAPIETLWYQYADATEWIYSENNTKEQLAYKESRLAEQFRTTITDIRLHFKDWHDILDRLNDLLGVDIMTLYPSEEVARMLTVMQSKGIWLDDIIKQALNQKVGFGEQHNRFNKDDVLKLLADLITSGNNYSQVLLNFEHSRMNYDELVKDNSRYSEMLKRRYGITDRLEYETSKYKYDEKHFNVEKDVSKRRSYTSGRREKTTTIDYKKKR